MYLAIWYDGRPTTLKARNDMDAVAKFQAMAEATSRAGCALWRMGDLSDQPGDGVQLASYADGEFSCNLTWTVIGFYPGGYGCASHHVEAASPTEALRKLLTEQEVAREFEVVDVILGAHDSAIQQATSNSNPVPLSDFAE